MSKNKRNKQLITKKVRKRVQKWYQSAEKDTYRVVDSVRKFELNEYSFSFSGKRFKTNQILLSQNVII